MSAPHTMDQPRRRAGIGLLLVALLLIVPGTAAGCGDASMHDMDAAPAVASTDGTAAAAVTVPMGAMTMPTQAEISAAWKTRPSYVQALPSEWQGAYAFALARPDVLQWLPCYCGCGAMGHGSNLDCFFQRRDTGSIAWEEHASFCDICVETANMASTMLREGRSMTQIRAAVDATFGGTAPGTDTPLPPA
jgi:hypothetical protein